MANRRRAEWFTKLAGLLQAKLAAQDGGMKLSGGPRTGGQGRPRPARPGRPYQSSSSSSSLGCGSDLNTTPVSGRMVHSAPHPEQLACVCIGWLPTPWLPVTSYSNVVPQSQSIIPTVRNLSSSGNYRKGYSPACRRFYRINRRAGRAAETPMRTAIPRVLGQSRDRTIQPFKSFGSTGTCTRATKTPRVRSER